MTAPAWNRPADQIRDAADRKYSQLRAQADTLRPDAIQRAMAKTYTEAKTQLDQMGNADGPTKAAQIAELKRQAYGVHDLTAGMNPASAAQTLMSFRDAQQRVSSIGTPSEAKTMLAQARQTGDELMARAVGNHAMANGWDDVAGDYLAAYPAKQAASAQLADMSRTPTMADILQFACPKPSELDHLTDSAIAQLAQGS